MANLDLVFVGLCAIVVESELDCNKKVEPDDYRTSKFDVALIRAENHDPRLLVRPDGIKSLVCDGKNELDCFDGCLEKDGQTEVDQKQCLPCRSRNLKTRKAKAACREDLAERWAEWKLDDTTVTLQQSLFQFPEYRLGHRNVVAVEGEKGQGTGGCSWAGSTLDEGCGEHDPQCENDLSWLPELNKAIGEHGEARELKAGTDRVTALFEKISGDLHSSRVWRQWYWVGRDAENKSCELANSVDYSQSFASRAVMTNALTSSITLWYEGTVRKIKLEGDAFARVENVPTPGHQELYLERCPCCDGGPCLCPDGRPYPCPDGKPCKCPNGKTCKCPDGKPCKCADGERCKCPDGTFHTCTDRHPCGSPLENRGFRCVAEHFRHLYKALEKAPSCLPVPATRSVWNEEGKEVCPTMATGYAGITDPFCPPTIINKKKETP